MAHDKHHFIPKFLLQKWQTGADDKLTFFRWSHGQLRDNRRKAKSVAKLPNLYSTNLASSIKDNSVERDFMGPLVDDPAAVAHSILLTEGISALSPEHRKNWALFLLSQWLRVPDNIALLKQRSRAIQMRDNMPAEEETLRNGNALFSATQFSDDHDRNSSDDLAIHTLPYIVNSKLLNGILLEATWKLRKVKWTKFDFVIGDVPLIYEGQMNSSFLIALPLSPRLLFVAYSGGDSGKKIDETSDNSLVVQSNLSQAMQAKIYVFATDDNQRALVIKHLQKPDKVVDPEVKPKLHSPNGVAAER
jgi:hypothetical protein